MAVWRFVDFSVREAQLLADLTGVKADLDTTQDICDILLTEMAKDQLRGELPELVLKEALCAAAIVRYGRSFSSGSRTGVSSELIDSLSPELREDHRYFKALRDKWIAHSVNAFEENQVAVYLTPEERGPKRISSVSVQHRRVPFLSRDNIYHLKILAGAVAEKVEVLIEQERIKTLDFARSLPVEPFYTQIDPPLRVATDKDAGKPRRRW